ncbi:MAG: serine/threonine protein kinase [Deltaproteobacteria bacterium]
MEQQETARSPAMAAPTNHLVYLPALRAPSGNSTLGPYELVATLGDGGMGSVCIARRSGPGGFARRVAIKRIHAHLAAEKDVVAMFLDEARLAASVSHRNVAQIYELGVADDTYYLVMEFVEGTHLGVLRRALGQVSLGLAAYVVAEAAHGLHAAHEVRGAGGQRLGLVHRDVSPSNILLGFDGSVKVTDFDIAKAEGRLARTDTGQVRGKASYMAPEQALGEDVDRRADVFALGVVLFELCSGRKPFGSGASAETMLRVLRDERPRLEEVAPSVPAELADIVERCLSTERAQRYPTAALVAEAIDSFRNQNCPFTAGDLARTLDKALGSDQAIRRRQLEALERALEETPVAAPSLDATAAASSRQAAPGASFSETPARPAVETGSTHPERPSARSAPELPVNRWPFAVVGALVLGGTAIVLSAAFRSPGSGGSAFTEDDPEPIRISSSSLVDAAPSSGSRPLPSRREVPTHDSFSGTPPGLVGS